MNAFSFPRTLAVLLLTATTARAELMNYGTDDSDDSTLVSAEDLESCGCENTSGVTLGNGSSSQFSATSMSSDDCGPFDTSLTAVLGGSFRIAPRILLWRRSWHDPDIGRSGHAAV